MYIVALANHNNEIILLTVYSTTATVYALISIQMTLPCIAGH